MKHFSKKVVLRDNLISNFNKLKAMSGCDICAVVKANAYGHGDKNVCNILNECCNFFAVSNLSEALRIRSVSRTAKILILGYCSDYNLAIKNNISIIIDNFIELNKIIKLNKKINIHIKINSGMNRLGIRDCAIFNKILKIIKLNKNINFEGIFTHFYDTNNIKIINYQYNIFEKFIKLIPNNIKPVIHIGGSKMINHVRSYISYVRCGIMLYGYQDDRLKKCMRIESRIQKITTINKGEAVGYDSYFVSDCKMKVALIPLGYADGISQDLQDKICVKIHDKNCKIVGKICMDMFMCDVSNLSCKIGDKVVVFDDANIWSKLTKKSCYEILTSLNNIRADLCIY